MSIAITWLLTIAMGLSMPTWCCCRSMWTGSVAQARVVNDVTNGNDHACCASAKSQNSGRSVNEAEPLRQSNKSGPSVPFHQSCPMDNCPSLQSQSYNIAKTTWSMPPAVELSMVEALPVMLGRDLLVMTTQVSLPRSFDRPPPLILNQSPVACHSLMTI